MSAIQQLLRLARHAPELRTAVRQEIQRLATGPRDIYLPKEVRGTPPTVPEGTDLAVWSWESNGVPYAIAFAGKQNKPLWHHRFRNEAERERHIAESATSRRNSLKMKQDRVDERKNFQHPFKKGDILYSSWGYEQTNVDFYEVTDVAGKAIVIREIGSKEGPGHSKVIPQPGHFIGAPMRKVPQGAGGRPYVRLTSYSSAYRPTGTPKHVTPFGAGH